MSRVAVAALVALHPVAWAQEAAGNEGISPAFWIAVSVPIVLGVTFALRAATAKKKKD